MTELQEFLKECDCDVIQKSLAVSSKAEYNYHCSKCYVMLTDAYHCDCPLAIPYLLIPTTQQLIDMLGDRFVGLNLVDTDTPDWPAFTKWYVVYKKQKAKHQPEEFINDTVVSQSPRLALIRAVKEVLK